MTKHIELKCGTKILVDEADYGFLSRFNWQMRGEYATKFVNAGYDGDERKRKMIFMHKVILLADDDMCVDHINGDKLDNRRQNLRLVTRSQNNHNRRKVNPDKCSSKYKGVSWNKKDKRLKPSSTISAPAMRQA